VPNDPRDERHLEVQDQQRPIAEWMLGVMRAKGLNPTGWAKLASLGRDTVSRAVKDDYKHVTSTTTLLKLARAAGVAAPVHLGAAPRGVPSAEVLAGIFDELLTRLVPDRIWPKPLFEALGKALRHTLLELAEDGERPSEVEHARMAARIASRQIDAGNTQTAPGTD
jgi:hypothetical protein